MTDELERIAEFVHRETVPDRSGEVAALQSEVDMLRHENMKLRFENSGLYAKIEKMRWEIVEFQRGLETDREEPGNSFVSMSSQHE